MIAAKPSLVAVTRCEVPLALNLKVSVPFCIAERLKVYIFVNYIEQEIQRGSTCLEIMKYIKVRSSFLSVGANSTVEGGQSRNKPLAQRVVILLVFADQERQVQCSQQAPLGPHPTPREFCPKAEGHTILTSRELM